MFEELLAFASLVETVGGGAHGLGEGEQRTIEPRLGDVGIADADEWLFVEEALGEETEKLMRGLEGVADELALGGAGVFLEEAAFGFWIVEIFQHPLDAVAGKAEAEVIGGDIGDGVGLVENEEIIGKQNAARAALGRGAAGVEVREQKRVIHDDHVGLGEAGAGALVETFFAIAVFAGASGGIGVHHFPDVGGNGRREFVAKAVAGRLGPGGDALEFAVFGRGEELVLVAQRGGEARGA